MITIRIEGDELKGAMKKALLEIEEEKYQATKQDLVYTKTEAMQMLKCGYAKLNNLIKQDLLKTTPDGKRVLAPSLEEYLESI